MRQAATLATPLTVKYNPALDYAYEDLAEESAAARKKHLTSTNAGLPVSDGFHEAVNLLENEDFVIEDPPISPFAYFG
ncbi:hypothetical protein [Antribacter gilvus]|uniref:hypothetical protein n=1 Tax=Antribacter gilvus TaxID=2304675 RepID=UPI000F781A18|nr:hypothetical protein [Antribacter gilvus]